MCELSLRERHYKDDLYRYPREELIDYILALEKAYRVSEESKQIIFDGYMQTMELINAKKWKSRVPKESPVLY